MKTCLVSPLYRIGPWTIQEYGVGSLPLALGGDLYPYQEEDLAPLAGYDILLFHVAAGLYEKVLRIMDRFPGKPAVLNLVCDAMYIDPYGFFQDGRIPLKALLDRAALALCEANEVGFFQAMTATPVVHVPVPLPLAAMRAVPRSRSSPPLVYLGSGFRAKKNGIATALAFARLRSLLRPAPRGVVFEDDVEAERRAYAAWGIEGVEVRPSCDQQELWRQVACCDLGLHLDYRRTVGRFSGECAALGLPCISTASVTMQRVAFPELIVEPWDVEGAALLAARVLRDPQLHARLVSQAARAIEPYDLAPLGARLRELLGSLLPGKARA